MAIETRRVIKVKAEPLTAEAYAPFGAIVEAGRSQLHCSDGQYTARKLCDTGKFPVDLRESPDGRFLYVSCFMSDEIQQWDVSDLKKPRLHSTLKLAIQPNMMHVTGDGKRMYITNSLLSTMDRPGQFWVKMAHVGPDGMKLQQWVRDGPVKQGLDRDNWTYAELADHLYKTQGIRVQKSAMQAFCHKHDIRPYRPTYRFLRGDPAKQAAAREDLAVLKKKRRRVNSPC